MELLTAAAVLAAALLTGGVPAVALIAQDPPADEKTGAAQHGKPPHAEKTGAARHGKPPHAGKQGGHGNPHGPEHGADMQKHSRQHAQAMRTWGPCMESMDASGEQEPSRAEKLEKCGPKPTPPGHLGHEHAGHKSWHKFHPGPPSQARPGNR